ncbi:Protein Skeletor, isoforms D/E [Orchesella cincta]|uniref:Protein Skeletor, isoforms D/E n=1 Tax=Orchesella cincta TaxID=48709 RepID=A0A1D2MBV4_ORCCI|nr:Protein Skeletor, isoforms D/E [Orchesella cincta]
MTPPLFQFLSTKLGCLLLIIYHQYKMGALQILMLIATGIAPHIFPTATAVEISLGTLPNCAHKLGGEVFVKNEREVIIKGFHYDGKGPAAWFHAMRRGTTGGIYNSDDSYFYTLPDNHGSCFNVNGYPFIGEDITLILPVSIKELETIGMLCYRFCQNFGYVNVPHDLDVPAAPDDLPETKVCPKPHFDACHSKGGKKPTKAGGPNCGEVGNGPPGSGGNKMEGRLRLENLLLAFIFQSIIITVILSLVS